jgi:hypothetical protein
MERGRPARDIQIRRNLSCPSGAWSCDYCDRSRYLQNVVPGVVTMGESPVDREEHIAAPVSYRQKRMIAGLWRVLE